MFPSRCALRDVPGMGSMTGERCSNHASATWEGVAELLLLRPPRVDAVELKKVDAIEGCGGVRGANVRGAG